MFSEHFRMSAGKAIPWAKRMGYPGVNELDPASIEKCPLKDIIKGVKLKEEAKEIKRQLLLYKLKSTINPNTSKRADSIETYDNLVKIEEAEEKSASTDKEIDQVRSRIERLLCHLNDLSNKNDQTENRKALILKNLKSLRFMDKNTKNCISELSTLTEKMKDVKKKTFMKRDPNFLFEQVDELLKSFTKGNELSELNDFLNNFIVNIEPFHPESNYDSYRKLMPALNDCIMAKASELSSLRSLSKEKRNELASLIENAQENLNVPWIGFYLNNKMKQIENSALRERKRAVNELLKKDLVDDEFIKYSQLKAQVESQWNKIEDLKEKIRFSLKVNFKNLNKFTSTACSTISEVSKAQISCPSLEPFKNSTQMDYEIIVPEVGEKVSSLVYDECFEEVRYLKMLKGIKFSKLQDGSGMLQNLKNEELIERLNHINEVLKDINVLQAVNKSLMESNF